MILIIFATLSCVSAGESNLTFSNENKDVLNANLGDFSTLADEISNAQSTSLNLTRDYQYDGQKDSQYRDGITISTDNFIIDGQGHTIDANNQARIFKIQSKNVIIKNINLINGNATSHGGAIYWTGDNGSLINSTIKNSISPNSGGAVLFKKTGSIMNSRFTGNTAYFGGGVCFDSDSKTVNCQFEDNFATFLGGGLYTSQNANITDSSFVNNEAGDGGGIYLQYNGRIDNCSFQKNNAIGYGGAITGENKVIVRDSEFLKNTAKYAGAIYFKGKGYVHDSNFTQNSAEVSGAVYATSDELEIINSEFNHNVAPNGASLYITAKSAKIENTSFNNDQSSYQSEIYSTATPTLSNVSFNNVTKKEESKDNDTMPENKTSPHTDNGKSNTVIVKKTAKKTRIYAKSKTFKLKKAKKYIITLKSGKTVLKKKKVTLKINGKTYTKKTNSKGKCVFKLKMKKKGKFKAVIRFKGDKSYKASKKTVKIKIK